MTRTAFIIMNPVSGQSKTNAMNLEIQERFDASDWVYDTYELTEGEDAAEVAAAAVQRDYDMVVAAGGDGTVCRVAGGLVGSGIPMGIIPTGTGNALAQDLQIPLTLTDAVKLLVSDHDLKPIDAMKSEGVGNGSPGYYFLNVSIGMSSAVMLDTDSAQKRQLGIFAYVFTGLRKLAGIQPVQFDLHVDSRRYYLKAADIVIANSAVIGLSALRLDRDIALDDGEVSVCIIRARSAANYVQRFASALLSRNRSHSIQCIPARGRVTIRADRPLPVQADGDPVGHQQIEITVVPRAVSIVVPIKERSSA